MPTTTTVTKLDTKVTRIVIFVPFVTLVIVVVRR